MKVFTYIKENSTRVPGKNFQLLGETPLWQKLTLEISSHADLFVDTDSKLVLDTCKRYGITAYPRKQEFIDMEEDPHNKLSPALLMVDNFLNEYVEDDDEVIVLVHVTSPFLKWETILDASNKLNDGYEFVHSVTTVRDFAWLGDDSKPLNFNPKVVQRTQDLEEVLFSNGAFFIFRKGTFKRYNNRLGEKNYLYRLGHIEGLEIDTEEDLEFAKIIMRGLK
jgi:CMP-N-acetylneuraminic acid synthetase